MPEHARGGRGDVDSVWHDWLDALLNGLWYAVPIMTILLCHEMGHFIQAHRYGVYASLPYFIPMPYPPIIGTLGAVIAMEPRMGHRKALFDIGITGPLAGLVPTFIFLIVGLHYSELRASRPTVCRFRRAAWYSASLHRRFWPPVPKGMTH